MKEVTNTKIKLDTIEKVKRFIDIVSENLPKESTVTLSSGRFVVDGKSVLAIFSLDLQKEIDMEIVNPVIGYNDFFIDILRKENMLEEAN